MWPPLRIVQRNAVVYRRTWRGSLFGSFLQPTLFLLSFGIGVGAFIDRAGAADLLPGGVSFLMFLAPGLLAGACMQTAAFESSYPILGKTTWQRNYEAIIATPISIRDIVLGELAWIAIRLSMVAVAFAIVMVLFGVSRSPLLAAAAAAGVLTGVAFAAPIMAYAVTLKGNDSFNVLIRFGISPLFLFSGIFFPISRLPHALQTFATITPLFHGVALARGLALGTISGSEWLVHAGYLVAMATVGVLVAIRTFERKLGS